MDETAGAKADRGQKKTGLTRIESIDILRGITILVMIFVNDIAGVPGTPGWMKHVPNGVDGMTFVDVVFPAFLFIVGMAMPFSLGARLEKVHDVLGVWKHILIRVFGLLVIGFYMVNSYGISSEGLLNSHLWVLLMYLSVIIIWNKADTGNNFLNNKLIRYGAMLLLVILAFLYTGNQQVGLMQMRPQWWGILGLIGWAYLVASLIYIPFRNNQSAILGGMILLYFFYMADEAGLLSGYYLTREFFRSSYTLGSHAAIILGGVFLGNMLFQNRSKKDHAYIMKWALGFSMALFTGGLLLHELKDIHIMFIISKNPGTVPWCLLSSAFTVWTWMIIYWLVDMKGYKSWATIVRPAGANPLFAYILAPLVMTCFSLLAYLADGFNMYIWLGQGFYIGLFRAILMAFAMTWLAGYLSSRGIKLKL